MLEALYGGFVGEELRKLIPQNSFASYITRSLGRELQGTIESLDEEDKVGFWGGLPVQGLYELLDSGWSLDHEWFAWTDGIYRDDSDKEIPASVPRSYSAVEQIAAYGLYWLNNDQMDCMGQLPDEGTNDQGWTREGIIEHKAECLLRAYQALVCGQKLIIGNPHALPSTQEEIEKAARIAMAKKAAASRHASTYARRDQIIAYWRENISADKSNEFAAELLQKQFPDVAHRTLAQYVAKAKKLPPAGTL